MRPRELLPSSLATRSSGSSMCSRGAAQHELAWVKHERDVAADLDHFGQAIAVLRLTDIYVRDGASS